MQRRWKLSSAQRADMSCRWKAGQSLNAIGVARHGGIAPPMRRRCLRALTLAERDEISRGLCSGESIRGTSLYSAFFGYFPPLSTSSPSAPSCLSK
jgi:hypothetical protein